MQAIELLANQQVVTGQSFTCLRVDGAGATITPSMTLGQNIERLRHAAGFHNAAAFARDIGVSAGNLGDWEKGRYSNLRLSNLLRLAKKLKVSVDELLAGIDDEYDHMRSDLIRPSGMDDVTTKASHTTAGGRADGSTADRLFEEVLDGYVEFRQQVAKIASAFGEKADVLRALAEHQPALIKAGRPRARRSAPRRRRGTND